MPFQKVVMYIAGPDKTEKSKGVFWVTGPEFFGRHIPGVPGELAFHGERPKKPWWPTIWAGKQGKQLCADILGPPFLMPISSNLDQNLGCGCSLQVGGCNRPKKSNKTHALNLTIRPASRAFAGDQTILDRHY